MTSFLHVLRQVAALFCFGVGLLVGTLGVCWTLLYLNLWFHRGALSESDRTVWLICGGASVVGALGVWAGIALRRAGRGDGSPAEPFRLVLSGPQRRWSPRRDARGTLVWLLLGAQLLWAFSDASFARKLPSAALAACLIYVGCHLCFLCHELGHLAVAALLGFDLQHLQVGTGPTLGKLRLGGLRAEWRPWLGGGFVQASDTRERGWRWRHWLYVAGGPAAHMVGLLALAGWILCRNDGSWLPVRSEDTVSMAALYVLGWSALALMNGLISKEVRIGGLRLRTDGKQLLETLRMPQKAVELMLVIGWMGRVETLWIEDQREAAWVMLREILARYPDEMAICVAEGHYLSEQGGCAAAAASYQRWLARKDLPEHVRKQLAAQCFGALARTGDAEAARRFLAETLEVTPAEARLDQLDALATQVLTHKLDAFLPDADAWTQETLELQPHPITYEATRGAVLVELGRQEQGEALLRQVWVTSPREVDGAISAFYLAISAKRAGRIAEARHWFARSSELAFLVGKWLDRRIRQESASLAAA